MKSEHTIINTASLFVALKQLNDLSGRTMTLFVLDKDGHMLGTVTDGDIRRALLRGMPMDKPVEDAAMRDYRYVNDTAINVRDLQRFRNAGITLVPVLSNDRKLVDIIDFSLRRTILPLKAVLMAGGKGERLRPATLNTPKPLLKIEGKAIIDYNVEALAACGIKDITVATCYLAEQIDSHFAQPVAGVVVKTVQEEKPLGTIGAVALTGVADSDGDTIVMNSDLLTTISFEDMYLHHSDMHADVTIAVVPYQVSVPYAILALDDNGSVTGIEEKPSYSYYANAGIYIFSNKLLATLVKNERCDATDLIEMAIKKGLKVTYYTIKGTWIDVGSPIDFRQAGELMRHHNSMNEAK